MGRGVSIREEFANRIMRYPGAIAMRLRIARLRLLGAQIGNHCWIRRVSVPRNPWDLVLSDGVALDDGVILLNSGDRGQQPKIHIGARTYVNRYTMFDASDRIEVGDDCMIGPFCYITDHDHAVGKDRRLADQPLVSQPVTIGQNVWIGAGAIILKGVQIGANAVIGAGAVVTRSVSESEVVAGVPARSIPQAGR